MSEARNNSAAENPASIEASESDSQQVSLTEQQTERRLARRSAQARVARRPKHSIRESDRKTTRRALNPPWEQKKSKSVVMTVFREVVSILVTATVAVFLMTALRVYIIDYYAVPSGSMTPTIAINDRILTEKVTLHFSPIKQLDIVTFTDPLDSTRTLVKRVIALEGQTVDLREGFVYVDGVKLDEPYTLGRPSLPLSTAGGVEIAYPYEIPKGCVWVMGDNRTDSADSRYFGPIDSSSVTGRGIFVIFPPAHFNGLH